jgi:hypothetical protein
MPVSHVRVIRLRAQVTLYELGALRTSLTSGRVACTSPFAILDAHMPLVHYRMALRKTATFKLQPYSSMHQLRPPGSCYAILSYCIGIS